MDYNTLHDEYIKNKRDLKDYLAVIASELKELIDKKSLKLGAPIERRIKEWNSIAEKIDKQESDISSILELTDLIGLRFVFLFHRQASQVRKIIKENFIIIDEEDTIRRLSSNEFGYGSWHYNVKMKEEWYRGIPTRENFGKFQAEIQIRTLSQHNWAATSHMLHYKSKQSVPEQMQRSIYRVAALLELVDLEFERVLNEREKYVQKVQDGNFRYEEKVDSIIVEHILSEMLPQEHYIKDDEYDKLVITLISNNITTAQDLINLIDNTLEHTIHDEKEFILNLSSDSPIFVANRDRIEKGIFYTHVGLTLNMLKKYATIK